MTDTLTPISSLQERYGLSSRQAVYDRINDLKIVPAARGKLSSEQLDILDKLDQFLFENPGAAIADFPKTAEVSPVEPMDKLGLSAGQLDKPDLSTGQLDKSSDNFIELVREIAAALKPPAPPVEPLLHLKELERAAAAGWLLTSNQVKELVGVKPVPKKGERTFVRGSFAFSKIPLKNEEGKPKFKKIGGQTAWRVSKIVE